MASRGTPPKQDFSGARFRCRGPSTALRPLRARTSAQDDTCSQKTRHGKERNRAWCLPNVHCKEKSLIVGGDVAAPHVFVFVLAGQGALAKDRAAGRILADLDHLRRDLDLGELLGFGG